MKPVLKELFAEYDKSTMLIPPFYTDFGKNTRLVQHFLIPHTLSTRYLRHRRVVVSQQCHRIASFLRLALTKISSTKYMGIKKTLY